MKPSASNSVLSVSSVVQPEVISPQQSAAILDRCERGITFAVEQLQRGERMNEGWRFLLGAQMIAAKPHITHGNGEGDGFQPWIAAKFPQLEYRTAANYMKFASTVLAVAPKALKSETVSLFKQLPERIVEQGINDQQREAIIDLVPKLMEGQPMMQFIKAHTEKPARKISFHCPHCGAENTGFIGRDITCVNRECGETITVKETTTPEEQIQAAIKDAEDLVKAAISSLRIVREHKHRHDIATDLLRALIDESIETNKEAKSILKKRKQKKGTSREGAKSAKGGKAK
jgi:hypothetical protein